MRSALVWGVIASLIAVAQPCAEQVRLDIPLGLIEPDFPLARPTTVAGVELGRRLFFDPALSRSGKTSCSTCHDPRHGFAEPKTVSVLDNGLPHARNAPSLYNVGYLPTLGWDGRFRSLEDQARDPFRHSGDMGLEISEAVQAVENTAEYQALSHAAFERSLDADTLAMALADYQRTLVSGGSPFDRYLFGSEEGALSSDEKAGLEIFSTKAGCLNCHDVFHPRFNALGGGVALFSDFRFHNLGVGFAAGRMADMGRYWSTREREDWGAFRTPNLRNLTLTAPYMHDGSLKSLREVIDFYDRGGQSNPQISPSIRPLLLTNTEKYQLEAFLKSLTDPIAAKAAGGAKK